MEGQTLSHYKVLEKLGGGGMGVVYKALDTRLDRHVALKFLPPELTRDNEARQRFVQEAKAASALDHPNICTIYEIDSTPDDQMFIVMAYYGGETIKARLEQGALPVDEALDIAIQVAKGLVKAHAAGIVHRDIKPANLIVATDGLVKIVDFGIAKLMGQTGPTQTGTTLGTVAYMAPEQINGEEDADQQTDVWALGVVLYEMLTGRIPFQGDRPVVVMNAIVQQALAPPSEVRLEIRGNVERVVTRALEKTREARYGSARELLREATDCHTALTRPVPVEAQPATAGASWLRRGVIIPAAVLVALVAAGAVWSSSRGADARWAREEAIPEILNLLTSKWVEVQRTGTTCAVSPAHLSSSNNHRLSTLRRLLAAAEQAPQPERGLRRRPSTEARKHCSGRDPRRTRESSVYAPNRMTPGRSDKDLDPL